MAQVEIIRTERQRNWSPEEKLSIVAETVQRGNSVSAVARRYDIQPSQLFTWRQQARAGIFGPVDPTLAQLLPRPRQLAAVVAHPGQSEIRGLTADKPIEGLELSGLSRIEIALPSGIRVWVDLGVDTGALRRVLAALS